MAIAQADLVLHGRMLHSETSRHELGGRAWTFSVESLFEVSAWWKGGPGEQIVLRNDNPAAGCGLHCGPVDTDWLIYAKRGDDGSIRASRCGRSSRVGIEDVLQVLGEAAHRHGEGRQPSALVVATLAGDASGVRTALSHGADPRAMHAEGRAMDLAVRGCQVEVARVLARAGAHLRLDRSRLLRVGTRIGSFWYVSPLPTGQHPRWSTCCWQRETSIGPS